MKNLRVSLTKSKAGLVNRYSFEYQGQTLWYSLITNSRLKHLYIQIHPQDGIIVKNPGFTKERVEHFLQEKGLWILRKSEELANKQNIPHLIENEGKVLYLGEPILLSSDSNPESFYKEKTIPLVTRLVEEWSFIMGVHAHKISFRKAKRRWGSCSHLNELSFNLSLAQLPLECVTYIVIHELAHIKHKHHQKAFWDCVAEFMPHYRACEKIIKNFSPSL